MHDSLDYTWSESYITVEGLNFIDVTTNGDFTVTQGEGKIDTLEKVKIRPGEFDCVKIKWKKTSDTHLLISDDSGSNMVDDSIEFAKKQLVR